MTNEIMVDLETMDTKPTAAIVAIGAVAFNDDEGVFDEFYINVDLQSCISTGRTVDGNTIMWWLKQSADARDALQNGQRFLLDYALYSFGSWLAVCDATLVWGNGAAFDNVILADAYHGVDRRLPWKFYNDRCYRTVKNMFPEVKLERVGEHHNALDDAKSQALHLLRIRKDMLCDA